MRKTFPFYAFFFFFFSSTSLLCFSQTVLHCIHFCACAYVRAFVRMYGRLSLCTEHSFTRAHQPVYTEQIFSCIFRLPMCTELTFPCAFPLSICIEKTFPSTLTSTSCNEQLITQMSVGFRSTTLYWADTLLCFWSPSLHWSNSPSMDKSNPPRIVPERTSSTHHV